MRATWQGGEAVNIQIDWTEYRKREFVVALGKFAARFPKRRRQRATRRPAPLWRWVA